VHTYHLREGKFGKLSALRYSCDQTERLLPDPIDSDFLDIFRWRHRGFVAAIQIATAEC
jgi:hypothetical protein